MLEGGAGITREEVERLRTAFRDLGVGDGPIYGYYNVTPQELLHIHTRMCVGLAGGNISLGSENGIEAIRILCHLSGLDVNGCGVKCTMIYWRDPGTGEGE